MPLEVTKGRLLDIAKPAGTDVADADAAVGDVKDPKTFYAVAPPKKTGTMATVTIVAANDNYPTGYHAGDAGGLDAIDPNLAVANIKSGVTIFGKAGSVIQQGTETVEKYADAVMAFAATYTPAASGIFFSVGSTAGVVIEYFSTLAGVWEIPGGGWSLSGFLGAMAIGDGTNFRIRNATGGVYEYCLMRQYYSTGTYERARDEQLADGTSWTPAVSGLFACGAENKLGRPQIQIQKTTAGWSFAYETATTTQQPLAIVPGDGTNLRVINAGGFGTGYHVTMRAKLT